MNIAVDTCILLDAIDDKRTETLLNHLVNAKHTVSVPLTVAGELLTVCLTEQRKDDLNKVVDLCVRLDAEYLMPRPELRGCCACMDSTDDRKHTSITDRTHIAYAKAWESDYFLTTDKEILGLPPAQCDPGSNRVIDPDALRELL